MTMYEIRRQRRAAVRRLHRRGEQQREALRIAQRSRGVADSTSATVYRVEKNGDRTAIAAYENINGGPVKVNVGAVKVKSRPAPSGPSIP